MIRKPYVDGTYPPGPEPKITLRDALEITVTVLAGVGGIFADGFVMFIIVTGATP